MATDVTNDLSCAQSTKIVEKVVGIDGWARDSCVLGIDEAGRGPVLGPMVYAAAYAPLSLDLKGRDFADSKTLSSDARDNLFASICKDWQLGYCAEILSAQFISTQMLSKATVSLNALANNSTFNIIRRLLAAGVNITQVYVDTVGDADRYQARLSVEFPGIQFTVCPKADALYPIVSGASIVAKVTRDRALHALAKELGIPGSVKLGTGYPGDPDTKAWLKNNTHPLWGFKYPEMVRFSWETCTRMMQESGCTDMTWEADDLESAKDENSKGQQQRITFGTKRQADVVETSGLGRHGFFRIRKLQRLATCI